MFYSKRYLVLLLAIPWGFAQAVARGHAQTPWTVLNPGQTAVFVKNYGQFPGKSEYVVNSNEKVFFTARGYVWKLDKRLAISDKPLGEKKENREEEEEEEEEENRKTETYLIKMTWQGSNPNAKLLAEEEAPGYYTYTTEGFRNLKAKGYKKLIYKDLYPNIDVEYTIPDGKQPEHTGCGGIKYSIILHPGANVNHLKIQYSGDVKNLKLDAEGNLRIQTPAGNITDHAPLSFYADGQPISLSFEIRRNTVFFVFGKNPKETSKPQNQNQTLIIDPWTTAPNLFGGAGPYDVDYDRQGNVYIDFLNGGYPQISKYSSTGTFLWTLNMSPISQYYSKFYVLPSGSVFIASGVRNPGLLDKISTDGLLLSAVSWPGTLNYEGWVICNNKCSNVLLVGGGGYLSGNSTCLRITDTTMSGVFTGNDFDACTTANNDMACMRLDDSGDMYSYFTSNLSPTVNNTIFKSTSPYSGFAWSQQRTSCLFGELSGLPDSVMGCNRLNVMEVNAGYLFFFDGQNLEARNKTTGALLASTTVSALYTCGGSQSNPIYKNEGIAADNCNNIYVGGQGFVHTFNFNGTSFTALSATAVPGNVYGIALDRSKQLLYVVGLNFLSTLSALPCDTLTIISSITPARCNNANGSATATASGGLSPYAYQWTNGATSLSGPMPDSSVQISSLAPGTYTLTVTDASCSYPLSAVKIITIRSLGSATLSLPSPSVSICSGATATLSASASGGSLPYTYSWTGGLAGPTQNVKPDSTTTYQVSVMDSAGCSSVPQSVTVKVTPLPKLSMTSDSSSGCGIPLCIKFSGITSAACASAQWNFGDGDSAETNTPRHCYATTGNFTVRFSCTDSNGCTSSTIATDMINVYPKPVANFSYNPAAINQNSPVSFTDLGSSGSTSLWNFNDPHSGPDSTSALNNPVHTFKDSGKYCIQLIVLSPGSCTDTLVKCLEIHPTCELSDSIPNVFTPNGDGINDVFSPGSSAMTSLTCEIYNRWGTPIASFNGINDFWDGHISSGGEATAGTYYYILKATCANGIKKEAHGFIELLR